MEIVNNFIIIMFKTILEKRSSNKNFKRKCKMSNKLENTIRCKNWKLDLLDSTKVQEPTRYKLESLRLNLYRLKILWEQILILQEYRTPKL